MRGRRGLLVAVAVSTLIGAAACGARPEQRTLAPAPDAGAVLEATAPPETTVAPAPEAPVVDLPGEELTPAAARPRAARAPRPAGVARPSGPQVTGRIEIPKIGLSHTTYEGISMAVINHGPSHWPGTPMPGHVGNSVFPGHRTTYTRPFWDLDLLRPGDHIIMTTAEGRFVYEVFDSIVVRANEMWITHNTSDSRLTIFGCHPKGSAKYRFVVRGRLIGTPLQGAPRASSPPPQQAPPQQPSPPPPTTTTTAPRGRNCVICL